MNEFYPKRAIVLFIPNTRWYNKRPWMQLPFTIAILTALLKGLNLKILDANADDLTEEETLMRLKEIKADVFLVSGIAVEYYMQYCKSFELAKTANRSCITVFGGIYPTLMPKEVLSMDKNIDYVFIGHAEERLAGFIDLILKNDNDSLKHLHGIGFRSPNDDIVINAVQSFISDVKLLVKPDYSLLDVKAYTSYNSKDFLSNSSEGANATIATSFGCPYNCSFCAARTVTGRKIVYRPVEDVLEEIEFFINNYNIKNMTIIDENFLANRKRVESILNTFIERKYNLIWQMSNVAVWYLDDDLLSLMRKSGCTAISPSVESGSPRVLRDLIGKPLQILEKIHGIVKKCKELDINVIAHFVIGLPGETWEEIRQTFLFAESINCDLVVFHIATPYPKTELYDFCVKNKLLPPDFSFFSSDFYGTSRGFITTDEFTPYELMVLRAFEWDRINFSSPQKTAKIARMMNLTIEELNKHRRQTRLKCGVHY